MRIEGRKKGSCGMAMMRLRAVSRGKVERSKPSTRIPLSAPRRRRSMSRRDDFPLPVRPQIPSFVPAGMESCRGLGRWVCMKISTLSIQCI